MDCSARQKLLCAPPSPPSTDRSGQALHHSCRLATFSPLRHNLSRRRSFTCRSRSRQQHVAPSVQCRHQSAARSIFIRCRRAGRYPPARADQRGPEPPPPRPIYSQPPAVRRRRRPPLRLHRQRCNRCDCSPPTRASGSRPSSATRGYRLQPAPTQTRIRGHGARTR